MVTFSDLCFSLLKYCIKGLFKCLGPSIVRSIILFSFNSKTTERRIVNKRKHMAYVLTEIKKRSPI